jgi:hypothetical protein
MREHSSMISGGGRAEAEDGDRSQIMVKFMCNVKLCARIILYIMKSLKDFKQENDIPYLILTVAL